jgi:hypothetical protein
VLRLCNSFRISSLLNSFSASVIPKEFFDVFASKDSSLDLNSSQAEHVSDLGQPNEILDLGVKICR